MTAIAFVIVNVDLGLKMKLFVMYKWYNHFGGIPHKIFITCALIGKTYQIHNTTYFVINYHYEIQSDAKRSEMW